MDRLILYIIGLFFVVGGIDYILGSPLKLGGKFEEGIKTMGPLALGMIGIYSMAPIISNILSILFTPLFKSLNLDPSILPGMFFAMDMGGYNMAGSLAINKEIGLFSGVIIASSLGATISFTIPVAVGLIKREDEKYFAKGVLIGLISIPIGALVSGIMMGIKFKLLLINIIPIMLFALLLAAGLLLFPNVLIKGFSCFGRFIVGLSIIGLVLQGIDLIFGYKILKGIAPLSESIYIVVKISFILSGAYPMIAFLNRVFSRYIINIGKKAGINSSSVTGLIGNLASNLLVFGTYSDMDSKGKVMSAAFAVSGAFVFGGQLGFLSGVNQSLIGAFAASKLVGGFVSLLFAKLLYEREANTIYLKKDGGVCYENQ